MHEDDIGRGIQSKVRKLVPLIAAIAAAGVLAGGLAASCTASERAQEANRPVEQPAESFNLASAGEGYTGAGKAQLEGTELLAGLSDAQRDKLLNAVYEAFGDERARVLEVPGKDGSGRVVVRLEDSSGKPYWATFQSTKVTIIEAESEPSANSNARDAGGEHKGNMGKASFPTLGAPSLDDVGETSKVLPEKVAATLADSVARWAASKGIPMSKGQSLADVDGAVSKGGKVTMGLLLVLDDDSNRVTCTYDPSANRITLRLD